MSGMLVLFHCESNPGFAASSHEHTFLTVAKTLTGDIRNVHYAYSNLDRGMTPSLPSGLTNVLHLNTRWSDAETLQATEDYVRDNRITRLLGFDQPVSRPMYQAFRKGGIQTFVSYWGAPMSSLNGRFKLLLKKFEVSARRYGPDHYIFQSAGMRETAVNGRGIPFAKTSIVKTGIDTERYAPDTSKNFYAHQCFGIPRNRKIIVFSGHMERRKGVHVILKAARVLTQELGQKDAHFLILGNRSGEKKFFKQYLQDPAVSDHITFGGYRSDVSDLLKSCSIGMIASVVWDSFPMSSLEMAATELPLLVSDLPGLNEAVTPDTGLKFTVKDHVEAAHKLNRLLTDPELLSTMGRRGRERVIKGYSQSSQAEGIINVFNSLELATELAL